VTRVRVGEEQAGGRVDHVVAGAVPGLSVHEARRLIAAGGVRVEGRAPRKGERLVAGQLVEIADVANANASANVNASVDGEAGAGAPAAPRAWAVVPDPSLVVAVLYVDEALVAIDKPAGVPSHPLRPGELGTAANALVARFPECATASRDAREGGLGHRLDNDTSGVLLAARSRDAWDRLRVALRAEDCTKTYLAEVVGDPPERGVATAAIGRAGRRGARVRVGAGRQPLAARTEWEVVERRAGTALVRARLHAGRAHQVRAHLAAAGHAIVGDEVYGAPDPRAAGAASPRLRLHAASIALPHPLTGRPLLIEAPLPAWAILRS
jgi:23S rRNA pseudouridine1911/1915/1917 synthase